MSMLKRLLGSLHSAVFDTSPDSGLAFFIRHERAAVWSLRDERLTVTIDGLAKAYDLSSMTVGQLAGQLVLDGFEVANLSPEFAGLSASVLLDGSGDTSVAKGDRIYAFRDILRVLFGGYARELRTAKSQVGEALKQMVITQAEGEWVDLWGGLFNASRPLGMSDADYQKMIPKEAFRIRVNGYAIEKAILELTGQRVHIEEPWRDMFRLDESRLSGGHRFYNGSTVGYHLIRPVSDSSINWDGIVEIIERNKAAGVIVLPPEEKYRFLVKDPIAGIVFTGMSAHWSILVRVANLAYLDEAKLSDYTVDRNWFSKITSTQMVSCIDTPINGNLAGSTPSHLMTLDMSIYTWPDDIETMYTSLYNPSMVMAYPTAKLKWKDGGKWAAYKTWRKPYDWRVDSTHTGLAETSLVNAAVAGSVTFVASDGQSWGDASWGDQTWSN